ncbi:ABC transporter permease [Labedella phragmitis]|uniref:ABC transporter permease n=1 Tax=Labedella phragmitis TaxID=2498849 RepID=A0A444PSH7_9MICO|nr:ABC transporter permease [Labedella phragmitis]RWZ50821.1 ABC transporter permease [Labedella phragmitis]
MIRFILRRLLVGLVLVIAVSALAYTLLYANSDNIARRILGQNATAELVARKAAELGLDRPLWQQYSDWFVHAVQGQFGRSWFTGELVATGVTSRLSVTLSIVIGATILSAVVGVVLGVLAATRGGWVDRLVQFVSILGFAIPGFLVALGLVLVFSLQLGLFKATGYVPPTSSIAGWLSSVTLPVVALALGTIVVVAQQVRGSVADARERDYVRTLRSRGLSSRRVVARHVLRNAAGPALAVLAVQFVGLLGGAVIVEQIFAIPGLGQLAVSSTVKADIPMVMGLVMATAVLVVLVNLVIDLAQAALNPKVRLS